MLKFRSTTMRTWADVSKLSFDLDSQLDASEAFLVFPSQSCLHEHECATARFKFEASTVAFSFTSRQQESLS